MPAILDPQQHFLTRLGVAADELTALTAQALAGADDGELFCEATVRQSLALESGKVKTAAASQDTGFGLRRVDDDFAGLVHSSDISLAHLKKAADDLSAVSKGHNGIARLDNPTAHKTPLYPAEDAVDAHTVAARIDLMHTIDHWLRAADSRVKQVMLRLNTETRSILVARPDGRLVTDVQPLVVMVMQVMLDNGTVSDYGYEGFGGRHDDALFFVEQNWQTAAAEALRLAQLRLEAKPAPSGEMPIVADVGSAGVIFHEAVGHGLEGDHARKNTSVYAGHVGQKVAAGGVTIVDDGSIPGRRGSITVDDEGTPSGRNVLIENGILKGFMQDRLNARLMAQPLTGNGRRESYACLPYPRMTNTYLAGGQDAPEDILKGTSHGLYLKKLGGGQVDTTSGNFMFEVLEAYKIDNGRIGAPVKGANLIGNGPNAMKFIDRIAPTMALDKGLGTCGKNGQGVPVGDGNPTLRIVEGITVGGTQ